MFRQSLTARLLSPLSSPATFPIPTRLGCGRSQRQFVSSTCRASRQAIGRITPKRIAVPRSAVEGLGGGSAGLGSGGFGSVVVDTSLPRRSIWRPLVFCALFGGGGYALLALYTNYDTQKWSEKLGGGSWWRKKVDQPLDREMMRAKQLARTQKAQKILNELPAKLSFIPNIVLVPMIRTYVLVFEFCINTPASRIAPLALISFMGGIFAAWKIRRLEPVMKRWFLHRPVIFSSSTRREWINCVTLFTSTISHQTFTHYAFNSFALFSFGSAAFTFLSSPAVLPAVPTSTHSPHFFAFLLVAGLFSSLSSHIYTNIFRLPSLLRAISHPARISSPMALAQQAAILPSLGASGAIYAAVTMTACAFPDSSVGIIFIPFVAVPIGWGVAGMVAVDAIGLLRGWRLFDHVAHLAGAAFGFVYYNYGRQAWAWTRRQLGAQERKVTFL